MMNKIERMLNINEVAKKLSVTERDVIDLAKKGMLKGFYNFKYNFFYSYQFYVDDYIRTYPVALTNKIIPQLPRIYKLNSVVG